MLLNISVAEGKSLLFPPQLSLCCSPPRWWGLGLTAADFAVSLPATGCQALYTDAAAFPPFPPFPLAAAAPSKPWSHRLKALNFCWGLACCGGVWRVQWGEGAGEGPRGQPKAPWWTMPGSPCFPLSFELAVHPAGSGPAAGLAAVTLGSLSLSLYFYLFTHFKQFCRNRAVRFSLIFKGCGLSFSELNSLLSKYAHNFEIPKACFRICEWAAHDSLTNYHFKALLFLPLGLNEPYRDWGVSQFSVY